MNIYYKYYFDIKSSGESKTISYKRSSIHPNQSMKYIPNWSSATNSKKVELFRSLFSRALLFGYFSSPATLFASWWRQCDVFQVYAIVYNYRTKVTFTAQRFPKVC